MGRINPKTVLDTLRKNGDIKELSDLIYTGF